MIQQDLSFSKVLVIDDDISIGILMQELLEGQGFKVILAHNAASGLASFIDEKPNLIILDVMLPDQNGFELCKNIRLKNQGQHVPIMMMTGLGDYESINKAYEIGATDFEIKPINWTVIVHRIRYMLRNATLTQLLIKSEQNLNEAQQIANMGSWEYIIDKNAILLTSQTKQVLDIDNLSTELTLENFLSYFQCLDFEKSKSLLLNGKESFEWKLMLQHNTNKTIFIRGRRSSVNSNLVNGIVQDVSEQIKIENKIHYLAYYDNLTGLTNRSLFKEILVNSIASAGRNNKKCAVMFMDLDDFKKINDNFGHDTGDALLQAFSERMKNNIRTSDWLPAGISFEQITLARLGGDEFTIILNDLTDVIGARVVAERILKSLSIPMEVSKNTVYISVSIGISIYPDDGLNAEDLLKNSDIAMYWAKNNGRNNYQFFNHDMNKASFKLLNMENRLRKAIENEELYMVYQPIYSRDKNIISVESLIRWHDEELGMVPPEEFIHLAEARGIIIPLGEWIITRVCNQIAEWRQQNLPFINVAINISSRQFKLPSLVNQIEKAIQDAQIPPDHIILEITESVIIRNMKSATETIYALKKLGIKIAMDDFGTGYSSLSHIKQFDLDWIKIDRSFVAGLPGDRDDAAIVKAILGMANELDIITVGEGVETEAQFEFLMRAGCREFQGYYLQEPCPAIEIARLLR